MKNEIANSSLINKKSFFWLPEYLNISAWIEHIPFAFWIVEVIKPKVVVELGVHNGASYFSFCQAIKILDIDSTCYGVDNWQGDEHAGFYGPEVYENVINHNSSHFSRLSTLIRSSFDEAVNYFIDGTIELLHIDGLHTYDAVKHDFETWLPKLSSNAVVLFHDINVRERNFGVFKFWEELKTRYNNFQFDFGHGLGVITLGKDIPIDLKLLFNKKESTGYFTFLRNFFSEKGHFLKSQFDSLTSFNNEKMVHVNLKHSLSQAEEQYNNLKQSHALLEASLNKSNETCSIFLANNEELRNDCNLLKVNLASKEQQFAELNEQFTKLQLENGELKNENEMLKKNLASKDEMLSELTDLSSMFSSENNKLNDENELIKKNLLSHEQKFTELNELFSKFLIENNSLKDANELFKKNLDWYKATFVDRSLPGVIKEKLKTFLK
ncbi:MAG TPA: class I SAM-dependent methyltransferase [Chitinophagaceae bacterium]|jgi:hypothetical protein|nr:class I SAM-dependent methyltransferase [Chitinophagaceae bacterium]